MPKLKTHSGAAKRFRRAKSGRVKVRRANRNHILTKVSSKVMRHARGQMTVKDCDKKSVDRMLDGS